MSGDDDGFTIKDARRKIEHMWPTSSVPTRQFQGSFYVEGDTWEELLAELQKTVDHVKVCGPGCWTTGGGTGACHHVETRELKRV